MIYNGSCVFGQFSTHDLNANSVWCRGMDNGTLFFEDEFITHGYGILDTNGVSNSLAHFSALWFGAKTFDGEQRVAIGNGYQSQRDLFRGPISLNNSYASEDYQHAYSPSIWKISKEEISYHVEHFSDPNYEAIHSILNWPANGNVELGIASNQAPFVDVDLDGVYNPLVGDYPRIKGDAVVYMIINDVAQPHTYTSGNSLGIEVHMMLYQYHADNYIDSTTFLNVRVVNRSEIDYAEFRMGYDIDGDIGCREDDYCGSDSLGNMIYFYNSSNIDYGCLGNYGFGENPPAFGVKSMNYDCAVSVVYSRIGYGSHDDETYTPNYWDYMNGVWQNGYPFHYSNANSNNGLTSTHTFTGNPFNGQGETEVSNQNASGDRKGYIAINLNQLNSGEEKKWDLAFIMNRQGNYLENVQGLLDYSDSVALFYESQILNDDGLLYSSDATLESDNSLFVYPNPTNSAVTVHWAHISSPSLRIFSSQGYVAYETMITEGETFKQLDIEHLNSGLYFVEFGGKSRKLILQK